MNMTNLLQGKLKGIDSWSAPAYAYPTEWSEKTRDAWQELDIPCISEFERKSTPHPAEPKDVTVTDEEMDAMVKQFASLKIEVLKKIYWHQYPDGRIEVFHPKLVRVRKDGSFFMYEEELQESPKPTSTPLPTRPARPKREDKASPTIPRDITHQLSILGTTSTIWTVEAKALRLCIKSRQRPLPRMGRTEHDQPGASASRPIVIKDSGSSARAPIILDIPEASAAEPILVGFPSASANNDVVGTSHTNPIVVHYPGISASDPIIVDVPGASTSDPIVVDVSGASVSDPIAVDITEPPAASSTLPRAANPTVVSIPDATEEDVEMASQVKVKGADGIKGKGRMPSHESTPESDSGSSRAGSAPVTSFTPFNASFATSGQSTSPVRDPAIANNLDHFIAQLGLPPASSPHGDVQYSLPPGVFDPPRSCTLPADLRTLDPFIKPAPAEYFPVSSASSGVTDPIYIRQPRTLEEEFAEIFKGVNTYSAPQAQIMPACNIDWDALLSPTIAATVYQSIPEVPRAALPAPVPQAQIIPEPQFDLLTQMQTGQLDTWEALYGADTYLELPRIEDIPPPSAWEGAFDPTLQAFLDQLHASATDFAPVAALPSQYSTFSISIS